jgi:hypothetical protein
MCGLESMRDFGPPGVNPQSDGTDIPHAPLGDNRLGRRLVVRPRLFLRGLDRQIGLAERVTRLACTLSQSLRRKKTPGISAWGFSLIKA